MKGHFIKRKYVDAKGKEHTSSTWTVWYEDIAESSGKRRHRGKGGFKTRKEAEAWFNQKADEIRRGVVSIDEKTTLSEYLMQWLASMETALSPAAYHSYKNHVELHIIPTLGRVRLRDLRPTHVEQAKTVWLSQKRKDGREGALSPRTVKHIFATLNIALNKAKKQHVIGANPCEFVEAPRWERKEMRALDPSSGAKLLEVFRDTEIGAAIVTNLGTGLRRGELLGLRWGDVDLDRGVLTVQRSLERIDREIRFKEPKTKRSRRTISLPAFVVERLRRHRVEQAQRFLALGLGRPDGDTLLFERLGEPWVPNTFGLTFARILSASELPSIRLHDLRHSYASLALASGVDLKTVSTALGHSTISTTADIYAHITPALMQSAADRLNETLEQATRK